MAVTRTTTTRLAASVMAAVLALGACSNDDADDATTTSTTDEPGTTVPADGTPSGDDEVTTGDATSPDEPSTIDTDDAGELVVPSGARRAEDGTPTDGLWTVNGAGTVEFTFLDDDISLVEVRTAAGWSSTTTVEEADRLEVEFVRREQTSLFIARVDAGTLLIDQRSVDAGAEPGRFALGPAGEAELGIEEGRVVLVDLAVTDGWTVDEEETADGVVTVALRHDTDRWSLGAALQDGRFVVRVEAEVRE